MDNDGVRDLRKSFMKHEDSYYPSEKQALQAEGELYRHFKGGIYRLVRRGILHHETLEPHVLYEHLYPHAHAFWLRPEKDFFSILESGEPRFKRIEPPGKKRDIVIFVRK